MSSLTKEEARQAIQKTGVPEELYDHDTRLLGDRSSITNLNTIVNNHETRLISNNNSITNLNTIANDHETRLLADRNSITNLNNIANNHETRITASRNDINSHATILNDHETRISTAQTSANNANNNANTRIPNQAGIIGAALIADALNNPARTVVGLRSMAGTGTSVLAAGSDHVHSISMKHLPLEAQDVMLKTRERIRAHRDREGPVGREEYEDLVSAVLHLQVLAYEDEDQTGEERLQKARRGELKEAHDYGSGPEPRRKHRWNRDVHPDILGG